jgi:ABC-2 type transport system ATP-binding protein
MSETGLPAASPGPEPLLEVSRATKRFGSRGALAGLSFSLRPGEIFALLGPNGAGKTTLVRAICGRVRLDSGRVLLGGLDPRESSLARARLGLVPQELALYSELTVRENLEVLGRLAGVARRDLGKSVRRALAWTGLETRERDRAETLSGGMKRRLNIAAGVLHRPRLLLLDEPTVGIDPAARESIHEVLVSLREEGMTILLTTHDLEQAEELADRVGIVNEGRLLAEGAPGDLVRESFGRARELQVTLADDPGAEQRARLESEGLRCGSETAVWSGPLEGGLEALSALGERLAAAGLSVLELRVRDPGLRGVFFRVTGRELSA